MNSLPPYFTTEIFNNSAFYKSYDYLTREQADKLYLSINALSNLNLDSLNVAVKGIAEPEKCLITNATNDISNINILSSNIISTTSRIETQNTSTTLITSSSNCDNYGLHLHSVLASSNGIYPGTSIAFNNSSSDNVPLANICLDKIGSGNGNLIFSVRNGTNCLEVARILSTGLNIAGNLNLTTPTAGFQTLLNAVNTSSNVTCQIQVGNTETFIGNSSNHNTVIMGNGSRLITCLPGGNIAIGGTTTTYKLGVNGTLNCTNLYRNDTICDLPLIQGVTTIGTCYANKVLTCNGTLDTIGLNSLTSTILICDTLSKTGTLNVTPTTLNLNPTTLQIRGTTLSATATEINILSGVTATTTELNYNDITTLGTAQANKTLTCNGTLDIININSLTATTLIGTLSTGAQPAITAIGPLLTPIAGDTLIISSTISEYNLILGNTADTAADVGIAFYSNGSPNFTTNVPGASIIVKKISTTIGGSGMDLVFSNKTSSQNAAASQSERMRIKHDGKINFGSTGDADFNMLRSGQLDTTLRFGADLSNRNCYSMTFHRNGAGDTTNFLAFNCYGTSNTLVLTAKDFVGIGTETPACGLDVVKFETVSMTGPLATGTSSAYTVNRSGTFSDSVSIYCRQALMVGTRGIYVGSDRRVKENIINIPPEDGVKFVKDINPKIYNLKGFDKRQIGYISQDIIKNYSALINLQPDNKMTIEQEGDIDGAFMSMCYDRVPAFLHSALKSVFNTIEELEKKIKILESKIN